MKVKRKILMMFALAVSIFCLSAENIFAQRKAVSGKEVTGTFRMPIGGEFKPNFNEIKLLALGDNKVKVSFYLISPRRIGPGKDDITANLGQAIGEAEINGDTAVYLANKYGGKCEITIKFVKSGQIKITQNEEERGCGFGLNVRATGTYKKVSSKTPTFESEQ
jgi:hypothetical protein